jgi:hypothetical protein
VPWSDVAELVPQPDGRVAAHLTSGRMIELPAVRPDDLPTLVAASGTPLPAGSPQ